MKRYTWLFLFLSASARPADGPPTLGFAWDKSPDPGVVNYRLYQALLPGARTNSVARFDVGQTNVIRIPLTPAGQPRWYSVTALDSAGFESEPSNEIAYIVPWVNASAVPDGTRFEFLRVKENTNLKYTLEFTEDFVVWSDQFSFVPEVVTLEGGIEHYKVDVPRAVNPKLFARVRVDIR